jgi:zinc protease
VVFQSWTLDNGARVIFAESRALPILDVAVDFRAGSAFDPPDRIGLAALAQHLARTGAGGLGEDEIARRLGEVGAQLAGRVDPDRAGFTLRTLSSRVERGAALDVFARVVQSPDFPALPLERERSRVSAQLREEASRPGIMASRLFFQAAYGNHPYAHRPLGDADGVRAITRETVLDFRRRHYNGVSAVVSVVGDVSRAEAEDIARQVAGSLPPGGVRAAVPPVPSLAAAVTRRVPHPAQQSHIVVGLPAVAWGDPDYFALLVGNHVLGGGGFSSRLVNEVRERRGYAYGVASSLQPRLERGPLQLALQTRKDQSDEALAVLRAVLAEFIARGPTAEEVVAARRHLVNAFPLRLDTQRELLDAAALVGLYDLPLDWYARWPRLVDRVTRADVMRAFRRLDPERLVTVVVGAPDESGAARPR